MFKQLMPAIITAALVAPAYANDATEATIRKAVEAKFGVKVEKITKTSYLGLYEVFAEGQMLYTDDKASAFFIGAIYDTKGQNVTGKRLFSLLPLDLAVKQVRGNGKGTLVTFEDPNCGYCKRLAADMQKLKDVTVYTFLYPILSEDSVTKSKNIWCASDRAKAWNDWMVNNTAPATAKKDCNAPIEKLVGLGQSFQVTGTPTLLFADGARVPGAVPVSEIEKKLGELAKN
jgi:thiol:disulfide interchange protein DsbC